MNRAKMEKAILAYHAPRLHPTGRGQGQRSTICPVCLSDNYGFSGRWKRCTACGYDRLRELIIRCIRDDLKRGVRLPTDRLRGSYEYATRPTP